MRISHFFIDRPIFAGVVSIVFVILALVSFGRLPVAQYPGDRAAGRQRHRPVSRRQRRGGGLHRRRAARAADQRRREHALHLVELDGRRALHDRGHLRPRHQSRYRPGAGAEPRGDRAAAPARRRAQHRRHGRQGLARPDDGRAPLLARQVARHAVHLQLRQRPRRRRAEPHQRRRLDHRVRQPRLLDARVARSRPAAVARADRRAMSSTALQAAERAGRLGRAEPAAGRPAAAPSRWRCRRWAGSPIPSSSATSSSSRRNNAVVRLKDVARVELAALDYGVNSYLDRDPAVGLGIFQLPGSNALDTAQDDQGDDGRSCRRASRPGSSTPSSTTRPSSSSSRSTPSSTTILEAVVLVVLVVILFLQTWRAAIIPIVAIPVSLIGTFFFMARSASRSTTCRCSASCWPSASWSTTPSSWWRTSSATSPPACRPREAAHTQHGRGRLGADRHRAGADARCSCRRPSSPASPASSTASSRSPSPARRSSRSSSR